MKKLFILAAAMSVAMSCTDADVADPDYAANVRDDSAPVFYGGFDDEDTRTYIDEKVRLLWTADDRVSIFTTTYNQQYAFDGETGDNSGSFVKIADGSFATGSDTERNYAVYPYAKSNKISYDNILTVTLPAVQTYAANSFGPGANTMVAVTENSDDYFLKFRNVGGFIKLKLYGDDITVASVSVMGNKSEPVAGKASVSVAYGYYPTVTMSDTATGTVTLDCGEGVGIGTTAEESTEFWLVVPPTLFPEGFTITVTDTAGKIFAKSTSKSIEIVRNGVLSMSAIEVVPKIPTNQIWYTSNDGNIVEPHAADVFGANIVSNTYENGKGVITFDGEVTSIGKCAFWVCSSLTSVTIPDSVTSIGDCAFYDCSSLTGVYITDIVKWCAIEFNGQPANPLRYAHNLYLNGELVTDLVIPDGVTSIVEYAFYDCHCLTSVNIPDGVTSIENYAFDGCSSLSSVNIPDSVTSIGGFAFYCCNRLTNIYCKPTTPPSLKSNIFENISFTAMIYVPMASVDAYKTATNWSEYADKIVGYDFN